MGSRFYLGVIAKTAIKMNRRELSALRSDADGKRFQNCNHRKKKNRCEKALNRIGGRVLRSSKSEEGGMVFISTGGICNDDGGTGPENQVSKEERRGGGKIEKPSANAQKSAEVPQKAAVPN